MEVILIIYAHYLQFIKSTNGAQDDIMQQQTEVIIVPIKFHIVAKVGGLKGEKGTESNGNTE